jgi:hypothetical protein
MKKIVGFLLELFGWHHVIFTVEFSGKKGGVYRREMWLNFLPQGNQGFDLKVGRTTGSFQVLGGAIAPWTEENGLSGTFYYRLRFFSLGEHFDGEDQFDLDPNWQCRS